MLADVAKGDHAAFRAVYDQAAPAVLGTIRRVLRDQLASARATGVLRPAVTYGYFAVNSEGDDLIVWKDETRTAEWLRFTFPRQPIEPWLSIAD